MTFRAVPRLTVPKSKPVNLNLTTINSSVESTEEKKPLPKKRGRPKKSKTLQ